jgi:hypothetical protein
MKKQEWPHIDKRLIEILEEKFAITDKDLIKNEGERFHLAGQRSVVALLQNQLEIQKKK